ncbi:tyrosine recombinase XerC [Ruminococcaceae bacterium OttesenSCG-928-A16]|nr:tyrosine recombinase XerC [Ruminococcaceae bacterium OttesenSCG-928-A16]
MSTYVNPLKPNQRGSYDDCPAVVAEYLMYSESIRGLSPRTVNGYYIDLRTFFKFLVQHRNLVANDLPLEQIKINTLELDFIKQIDKAEVYEYLYYVTRERDNAAATRARKLSSLRGFFRYLTSKTGQLQRNPVDDIETPKIKKRLPKYLSLDESIALLKNIQSDFYERDYCMITLFLNCGMRVTELVGINITDIKNDTLRVIGKGNKERIVYLNDASQLAIQNLLDERAKMENLHDNKALFVSKRTGKRLSVRRVQQLVEAALREAGLDGKGYSVHKLRHTAATLLYQYGQVDMLALKEILGHADVSTTQIYTHMDTEKLKEAAASSPLANVVIEKQEKPTTEEDE